MKPPKNPVNYLKHYGFFFPNAEIYGGLAKVWDWGPLGTELKRNLKNLWWKYFITTSPYNIGSDSSIITHPQVLEASGHLKNFNDWLVECSNCSKRYRTEELLLPEEQITFSNSLHKSDFRLSKKCPSCHKLIQTTPRRFNLLLSTNLASTEQSQSKVYLRPETCQGIFVNFAAIQTSFHRPLPFGIGQIGKSFRNEITLHHGIFRTREFEQMELEFFYQSEEREKWWDYWTEKAWNFLCKLINNKEKIKQVSLSQDELPHYAKKTLDLYFKYHFGWGELCSISDRGDYDLISHNQHSRGELKIREPIPNVIEVSFGVERLILALLENSYQEETLRDEKGKETTREVLKLPPLLTPYFVAIIPQPVGKKDTEQEQRRIKIQTTAHQLYLDLLGEVDFPIAYEENNNIGKAYRRQDAIGTYYCLTVDAHTADASDLGYNTVTIRQRDTMKQEEERIKIKNIKTNLNERYQKYIHNFIR